MQAHPHTKLSLITQGVLWASFAALAVATPVTHVAQLGGMGFDTYALMVVAASAIVGLGVLAWHVRAARAAPPDDVGWTLGLFGMAVAGACLAIFSYRADLDDVNYVPNAVHYVAQPATPMGFEVHYVVGEDGQLPTSPFQSTALPFEYLQAAFSHVTGQAYLPTRYFAAAGWAGLLVPLAWFWALWRLGCSSRNACFGALATLTAVLLLGDTFRSYGNYAFVRIHMGKAVLMTTLLPLFASTAIAHLREQRASTWWLLLTLATSSVGLTASAVPLLVLLVAALWSAHWFASGSRALPWRAAVTCGASLLYLFGFTIAVLSHARGELGAGSLLNEDWPLDFWGHARLMFSARPPVSAFALAAGLVAALLSSRGYLRRLLFAWCAFLGLTALNPWLAPFFVEHVTSPNIYWRTFYLLPFPLALGLGAAAWFDRCSGPGARRLAVATTLVFGIALHFVPGSPSVYHDRPGDLHRSELGAPRFNVQTDKLAIAERIAELAPPGPMLAPHRVSVYVPMVATDAPQVITRRSETLLWVTRLGVGVEVAEERMRAANHLGGHGHDITALAAVLDRYAVVCVVLTEEMLADGPTGRALAERSFAELGRVGEYVVMERR